MSMPAVASSTVALHAVSAGRGPLVVCLHSSGSSSRQWSHLIDSRKDDYRFIAFDFHGHGRSGDYAGDRYALRCESDAVWRTIESLHGPAHLVGHSFGGAVALDLAVRHPGRFASVTVFEPVLFALLAPGSEGHREIASVGRDIAHHAHAGQLDVAAAAFIDYWNGPGAWQSLAVEHRERVQARMVAVARHFGALFADPLPMERLRSLRTPTLVLRGGCSPRPARDVCARLATLPSVTTEVFPALDHMAPVTHAQVVNARIAGHLDASTALPMAA